MYGALLLQDTRNFLGSVCMCGHLDIKNSSIVSIQRWGGRGPEKHLSSKPFLLMATLDMQGTIPAAKSEKVLASWAGHSAKRKERGLREEGWKERGRVEYMKNWRIWLKLIQYIIWEELCHLYCCVISVNKHCICSEVKEAEIQSDGCLC